MDTITFTGQLLVATQNDTCQAINVIFDNSCKSCNNCYDVAITGIICGAIVLIGYMAMRILRHKLDNDRERAKRLDKREDDKFEWEKDKDGKDKVAQKEERDLKKKHEYQKELLDFIKERSRLKNEEREKYHEYVRELLDCLKKKCELTNEEDKAKFLEYQEQIKNILKEWKDLEGDNNYVEKVEGYINEFTETK